MFGSKLTGKPCAGLGSPLRLARQVHLPRGAPARPTSQESGAGPACPSPSSGSGNPVRWHSPAFSHLERLLGKKRIGTIQTETGVAILPPRAGRKWPGVERTAFKDSRMEKTEAASTWSIFSAVCETAPGFY